jgi:GTP diphosphokinase / guanosine-3',5'-bis(diphosphate) 3'-diphosphatase
VAAGIDDVNVLAAAALHDTVEDTETTFAELRQEFGAKISDYVAELSDDETLQ